MLQLGGQACLVSLHSHVIALGVERNSAWCQGRWPFGLGMAHWPPPALYWQLFAAMDVLALSVSLVLSQRMAGLLD